MDSVIHLSNNWGQMLPPTRNARLTNLFWFDCINSLLWVNIYYRHFVLFLFTAQFSQPCYHEKVEKTKWWKMMETCNMCVDIKGDWRDTKHCFEPCIRQEKKFKIQLPSGPVHFSFQLPPLECYFPNWHAMFMSYLLTRLLTLISLALQTTKLPFFLA